MKKLTVIFTAVFFVLAIGFEVCAADIKEAWSKETLNEFKENFGKDTEPEAFFEISESGSYSPEALTEYLYAHPEMLAEGMTVSQTGAVVSASDGNTDNSEDAKIIIPASSNVSEKSENPFELIWLGIIVLLAFIGAFLGIFAIDGKLKKKGEKEENK